MSRNKIAYSWRLREIMTSRGLNNISDMIPVLTERGVALSTSQICRLAGEKPERISLTVLGALIDMLDCTVEDLCASNGETAVAPKAINASPAVIDLNTMIRPKRAGVRARIDAGINPSPLLLQRGRPPLVEIWKP